VIRFDCVTLFPEMFAAVTDSGVTRRALEQGLWSLGLWNPRDYTKDAYRTVDDRPYGGGPGMVMLAEPLERALAAVRRDRGDKAPLIHFTPTGRPLTQQQVQAFAVSDGAVLLCARYEGVDQRFIDRHVDLEVSLGDYVLSGGELPALVLLDAVARLLPGVLSEPSAQADSFSDGLLEGPHYSRPEVLDTPEGPSAVPKVLLSGHHADIARWRREQALRITARRRPDLIARARAEGRLDAADEAYLRALGL
jgi:tRNA (guanine37-N1)-methyltransferase